ncbi:MAG: hypothetical protein HYY78_17510 [Betaproteobacteria bacterium]|nr:hypothetical protein [Betaproteobacteria bacterium]
MIRILKRFALKLSLTLAGCVFSLHPLYTDEDVVFDPALIGAWVQGNAGNTWEFGKGNRSLQIGDYFALLACVGYLISIILALRPAAAISQRA